MSDIRQTETRTLLAWFEECTYLQRNATPANVMRFMAIRSGIMKHLQIEFDAFYNWLYRVQKYKPKGNL